MTEENTRAEDVAAILAGKFKCPYCNGTGRQLVFDRITCVRCKGTRWIKHVVGDFYTDENKIIWVYNGSEYIKVAQQ